MSTKKSFSGQDLADLTGVEGITFRRYIRSDGTRVGRGKKYSFDADTASLLIQGFLTGKSGTVEIEDPDNEGETKLQKVEKLTEEQAEQVAKALIASEIEDEETEEDEDSTEDETEEPQGSTEDTETEDSDEETEDEDTEDES